MEFLKQYQKALATLGAGILIMFASKFLPADLIPFLDKPTIEMLLTGVIAIVFGRYIRLTKDEAEVLNEINKSDNRNQVIND